MRLTYLSGKDDRNMVPLLILSDIVKAMELLSDPDVIQQSGVLDSNIFMFPTTRKSSYHAADVEDPSRLTVTKQTPCERFTCSVPTNVNSFISIWATVLQ